MSEGQGPALENFGTLVRQYRLALGLSQEELADRSGLSVRAIANIERGRTTRPHRHSVQSLGDALVLPDSQRRELDRAARVPAEGVPPMAAESRSLAVPRQLRWIRPAFRFTQGCSSTVFGSFDTYIFFRRV